MIGFIIALISGALMSVQGVFNTQVTKTTGMWVSNGWVQFTALLVCRRLACDRKRFYCQSCKGGAKIRVARRRDWSRDYLDCN